MAEHLLDRNQHRRQMRRLGNFVRKLDPTDTERHTFWIKYREQATWFGKAILSPSPDTLTQDAANARYDAACQQLFKLPLGEVVFSEYCARLADLRNDPRSAEACRGRSEQLIAEQMGDLGQAVLQDLQIVR